MIFYSLAFSASLISSSVDLETDTKTIHTKLASLVALAKGSRRKYSVLASVVSSVQSQLRPLYALDGRFMNSIDRDVRIQDNSYGLSLIQDLLDHFGVNSALSGVPQTNAIIETCQLITDEMSLWPCDVSRTAERHRLKKRVKLARRLLEDGAAKQKWRAASSVILEATVDFLSMKGRNDKLQYRQVFSLLSIDELISRIEDIWKAMWSLQVTAIEALSYFLKRKSRLALVKNDPTPANQSQIVDALTLYATAAALTQSARTRAGSAQEAVLMALVVLASKINMIYTHDSFPSLAIARVLSILHKSKDHDRLPGKAAIQDISAIGDLNSVEVATKTILRHASLSLSSVALAKQYLALLRELLREGY